MSWVFTWALDLCAFLLSLRAEKFKKKNWYLSFSAENAQLLQSLSSGSVCGFADDSLACESNKSTFKHPFMYHCISMCWFFIDYLALCLKEWEQSYGIQQRCVIALHSCHTYAYVACFVPLWSSVPSPGGYPLLMKMHIFHFKE